MAYKYTTGLHSVGSYQVSGVPWITGSGPDGLGPEEEVQIVFPSVTKSVTVINIDAENHNLRVHFNSTSSGNVIDGFHYVQLDTNQSGFTFDVKCKEIYISNPETGLTSGSSYTVVAELTGITPDQMFVITGSGHTD